MIYKYSTTKYIDSGDLRNILNNAKITDIEYNRNQLIIISNSDLSEEEITAITTNIE